VAAPLRAEALSVLRRAILDFHYKPGQRLLERELMDDLGVSRTTIREVLRELAAEGLITSLPQRGMVVATLSVKEAREVYEVLGAVEELALRSFIARASATQVARMRAAFDAFEHETGQGGDLTALLRSKDDAFAVMLEGADNDAARTILLGLRARVRALEAASLSVSGRPEAELAELRLVVQGVERRDADAAIAAGYEHLAASSAAALAVLEAADAGAGSEPTG
jgi:DNA-binding GntR family transcriptional regulator